MCQCDETGARMGPRYGRAEPLRTNGSWDIPKLDVLKVLHFRIFHNSTFLSRMIDAVGYTDRQAIWALTMLLAKERAPLVS